MNGVNVWFNVNWSGVTGYYASYFDDSSYHSEAELTSKYGIPKCGAAPPAPQPQPTNPQPQPVNPQPPTVNPQPPTVNPQPPTVSPQPGTPQAQSPVSVYFSPYNKGKFDLKDSRTRPVYLDQFKTGKGCPASRLSRGYGRARRVSAGAPVNTLAGWSSGRVGVISYLANATDDELRQLEYVLLIDPGAFGEYDCDVKFRGGEAFAHWLSVNRTAHLAVISAHEVTGLNGSKGIQEAYFNPIRNVAKAQGIDLASRVLTCNYALRGRAIPPLRRRAAHQRAFRTGQYWIQNRIGTDPSSCPRLREGDRFYPPSTGWHP